MPIKFITKHVRNFLHIEASGGIVMIACAALAMLTANIFPDWYKHFTHLELLSHDMHFWVNDVLMVFFFFVIGMELKKELLEGFLKERSQIVLPLVAALFGMAAPALVYSGFNSGSEYNMNGWAIPAATDIAFAVAVLALFAKNFPPAAKIFLLAVAIFDDIGAILIIALYYNSGIAFEPFLFVIISCIALYLLNKFNISSIAPYMVVGFMLWVFMHECGIHTTLAGVILGMAIPMYSRDSDKTPLKDVMHWLHPRVSFGVLPLFAFTSAGVYLGDISLKAVFEPIPMGIALGLFIGKQIGIFGATLVLVKTRIISLPEGCNWMHIYAVSIIAGIGFTMSLFIGNLAFESASTMEMVKIGVLVGSVLAALWGGFVLKRLLK